ncbi:putative multidrug resistance protein [Acorus calamus]|uniref:Multidrug resistance protein n=1 Tax=Acorus calamus TaxID=4465 RepID=A0AAV9D092_ACOCL|nr:putative multidrug resistance protein [Acorus calamus]
MGEHMSKRVHEAVLKKLFTFEVGWFDQEDNNGGALCSRVATEVNILRSLVCDRLSLLAQIISAATLATILGFVLAWRLTIVILALQPLIIGSFYGRGVLMKKMSKKVLKAQNKSGELAAEAVINHRVITAFSSQEKIMSLFEKTQKEPKGEITTGRVIAETGSMTSDLSKGTDAVKSVFMILGRKSKVEPNDPDGIIAEKLIGSIEIKEVSFAYPLRPSQMVLVGLSLKVEAGKTIALVGQSGSGKSTIIGLVERFYDPLKGSIHIDGVDIRMYNLRALREGIGLVSQEPTLLAGTIYENITYGKQSIPEAEVVETATLANAHEFISGMKDGYQTFCGERGVQLSGGQKQRIALARAILKDPAILLLDEATSALDNISESLVQEAMDKMMVRRTCIVVAHRLSTIQKSDSIAVIENGKVVEEGPHTKLFKKGENAALSVGVANEVEKAARSFLWNGSSLAPKIHLICWESVTRDKKEGGLGIRRLTGLREAFLGIIAFKFLLSPSMLSSMVALKYKWNGNPWELVEPRNASPVWKSLCFGLRLIRPYVRKLPDEIWSNTYFKHVQQVTLALMLWQLWRCRNEWIFRRQEPQPLMVATRVLIHAKECAQKLMKHTEDSRSLRILQSQVCMPFKAMGPCGTVHLTGDSILLTDGSVDGQSDSLSLIQLLQSGSPGPPQVQDAIAEIQRTISPLTPANAR